MNIFGREVGGGKPKKPLQLVQRGTDTRIPIELVAQPSGEVLDLSRFERLSVKLFNDAGTDATPPTDIQDNHLIVEVTADISQALGTGVYSVEVTGRVPDTAFTDGYHDYTICTALCRVTSDGSDATPTKVTANVIEFLKGKDGKSAYEIAVKHGYTGTEEDWAKSLTPNGGAGGGGNGKSAYELAVQEGYQGTIQEWLKSLVGKDGTDAYEVAKKAGYAGSREEWLKTLIGATGLSAYELAKAEGYEGSLSEWLASLKGADGDSAYKVAVHNGYVGDEQTWLASLRGEDGKDAYEVAKAGGYRGSREEWLESLKGKDGKSAYELAKEAQNFTGSLTEYLASLKGVNGKSAYQSYLDTTTDDPKLTEKEWATLNATTTQFLYRINKGNTAPMNEQTLSADQLLELDKHRRALIEALKVKGVGALDTDGLEALASKVRELEGNAQLIVFKSQQFTDWKDEVLPTLKLSESYRPVDLSYLVARNPVLKKLPAVQGIERAISLSHYAESCNSLTEVTLPDLTEATNVSSMINNCAILKSVTIGAMPKATNLSWMLSGCSSLTSATIGAAPSADNAAGVFSYCNALKIVTLDFSGGEITNASYFFNGCVKLRTVTGTLDFTSTTNVVNTFGGCSSLEEVRIKGLKTTLDLSDCSNLSMDSIRYLVENAQSVTNQRIDLSRKLLEAHEEELGTLGDTASDKGFTFNYR